MRPRDVLFVVFPGHQGLDLVGPVEVFDVANRDLDEPAYRIRVAATDAGPIATSSGLALQVPLALRDVEGPVDTLVVVGGTGTATAATDPEVLDQVARLATGARRVASVCSGAFVLAAAGLLDGRRATTHWTVCDLLARLFPAVSVDPDPIYVRDGHVYTSAGVTAGSS